MALWFYEEMRKKPQKIIAISFVLVAILIAIYFYQRKDVEVTEVSTKCNKNICTTSFVLTNKTNNYISCKVSIRAHKRIRGSKTTAAVKPGFAGEKIMVVELHPKEIKKIEEHLTVEGLVSRINVNAFNVMKI
jgi:hypothetical protein